ncbi:MAG: YceI family protein, partial [Pedobacter sp.]|nr:YceI family protein [Pedobacter sp.]
HLDLKRSKLFWKGTKTIGTKHYGFILFNSGWLHTNAAGKLNDGMFRINMKSIASTEHKKYEANQKINAELKGSDFFEVAKYPTSSIVVKSIYPTANALKYKIEGSLTIKKTTQPIIFLATINQGGTTIIANANLTIDRLKWGIHETSKVSVVDHFFSSLKDKMIADEIPIVLRLVFVKSKTNL